MHVVYALGFLTWHAIERERLPWAAARLLRAAVASERADRVLVVDPWRSAAVIAKRLGRLAPATSSGAAHYAPLRLRRTDPTDVGGLRRSYEEWDRRVRRRAAREGLERPAVITNNPFVAAFAPLEWAGPVTLYLTDDLAEYPPLASWRDAILAAYGELAQSGRALCAVSQPLVDRIAPTGPAAVVPNGVDPSVWLDIAQPPGWVEDFPRPRIFYSGTLDRRIDADAVEAVAEAMPDASLLFVGGFPDDEHMDRLERLANVATRRTSVDQRTLASIAHACDVGIVPHARTRLTEAMSPLKLYEYLAAGLPVAATDLEPLRGVSERVVPAATPEEMPAAVERALALGREGDEARRAFVEENSWASRHERILDLALREA